MKFLLSRLIIAGVLAAPLSLAQSAYTLGVISLNPLGYWKLDGNLNDATQHNNSGTNANLANPITYTSIGGGAPIDAGGQAGVFNSSKSQSINIPAGNSFNFSILQPFTLMAWVKTADQGLSPMTVFGKVDATQTGYALVINNGPPFAPLGGGRFALFLEAQGAVSQVQSSVSVNDGAWHLLVATNDGTGLLTGIQLYLDGAQVTISPGPNNVTSSIANNVPLSIGGLPNSGSSLAPFEGLIDEVAIWNTVLTQAQIQQLAGFAAGARKIMSQFVFGGGWYSALYFSNTGVATVTFPVNFTADNGTPLLNIPLITGGATAVTLAPGTSTVIEAPNIGPLSQGYASFTPPPGIIGYGVFRQTLPIILNKPDQEAVVPFSSASTTNSTLLWDDTNSVTSVAIANPSPSAVTVTITVTKSDGSLIGTVTLPPLAPNSHTAFVLHDVVSGTAGNRGTAVFSVTSGNVAVLGLRATGIALTSIPTTDK
jgi:hypothetical protein